MNTVVPGGEQLLPGLEDPPAEPAEPTVLRMLLGIQLRRFREAAGITPEEAAYEIRGSRSKISRMETGRVGFKNRDITDLLTLYGVTDEQLRSRFLALVAQSGIPDWWNRYSDILPGWFETYLGLESAALAIRSFDIQFVNGLFQTRDYARAVIQLGHKTASAEEVEHRVALRVRRQDLLIRPKPPAIWTVMDEAVLRRPVGGSDVMRAQLEHLNEIAAMPHVTLQVIPFACGSQAGASGSFTVLRFEERDLPDVVYIEQLTSAMYLDQRPDVERYLEVVDELSGEALTPAATTGFIKRIAQETLLVAALGRGRGQATDDDIRGRTPTASEKGVRWQGTGQRRTGAPPRAGLGRRSTPAWHTRPGCMTTCSAARTTTPLTGRRRRHGSRSTRI